MRGFLLQVWALGVGFAFGFFQGIVMTGLLYGAVTWSDPSSTLGLGVAAVGSIVAIFEGVVIAILAVVQVNGDLHRQRLQALRVGLGGRV